MEQHSIENMKQVCRSLNHFIEQQKQLFSDSQQEAHCKDKSESECMDRWLFLRS